MWIQKIGFKIFLFFCMYCLTAHLTFAENNFAFRSFDQQIGEDIFQLTDVQKAILKFCRTLRIDPKNKTAQQNFYEIARHPTLTARQRSQVYLLEDLLQFNKDLKRRMDYWTVKRDYLKNQFIKNGYGSQIFSEGLHDIESNLSRNYGTRMYYLHALFDQSDPLILIYQILNDEKEQLLARVEYLQEQYCWLKIIRSDQQQYLSSEQFVRSSNIDVPNLADNVISVEPEFSREVADETIYVHPDIITLAPLKENSFLDLKGEQDFSQVGLNEPREDLKQKNRIINDLSKQVVDLSLRMSKIEVLLNKKVKSTTLLKAELDDINQRFMLEKRLIQEKDEEIRTLQITLDQLKTRSNNSDNVSYLQDEKLNELNGILEIYKYKLVEKNNLAEEKTKALTKTQDDLLFLNDQLTMLESELSEIKKHSQQDELKGSEIENEVRELQSKFEDIQHFLLENLGDSDKIKSYPRFKSSNLSN